jgi:hypothetical protein
MACLPVPSAPEESPEATELQDGIPVESQAELARCTGRLGKLSALRDSTLCNWRMGDHT